MWEQQKARRTKKYSNKYTVIFRIPNQVLFNVHITISKCYCKFNFNQSWDTICHIAKTYKPRITSVMVYWEMYLGDTWKINIDGGFVTTSGQARLWGIVRKENGDLIIAFAKPVQCSTNILYELQVAIYEINYPP